MSTAFRAHVTARLLAIRQANVTSRGTAATIATARMLLARSYYRRTLASLPSR